MGTHRRRRGESWHWLRCLLFTVALVSVAPGDMFGAGPAQDRLGEYQVKAAFLYNFMKFIEWPSSDTRSAGFVICVVGRDPFYEALEAVVKGKQANGREIVVRQLERDHDPQACHSVFIPDSDSKRSAEILERIRHAAVLTVGEGSRFLSEGGLIRLYIDDNHVRFQIDGAGARRVGLKVSSQLLSLAR